MIALLLALAQAAVPSASAAATAPPSLSPPSSSPLLGPIGRQALPARGCAAFLWSLAGDRQLVAMAVADPGTIRLAIGGRPRDYARTAIVDQGGIGLGLGGSSIYAGDGVTATLDMQVMVNANLSDGAQVPNGTLRIDRAGQDTLVIPVAGLIGCRT